MEQIMILSKRDIGSILDAVRGTNLEEHGILPSSSIGGCGAVYVLGAMVALAADIQRASMERRPNRGIAEQFMKPPTRPREALGRLFSAVSPHMTKLSSRVGETYQIKMYKRLHRELNADSLPVRLKVSDNFDYAKGMYDIGAIINEVWERREKKRSANGKLVMGEVPSVEETA
jgi:hypothetical protein